MFKVVLPRFIFRIERWKWNKEYRMYVSNMGHFMDEYKKIIPIKINNNGYVTIRTAYGFVLAHRLVMFTWRPTANMEALTVDHLDHNKRNNSVENLEWVTAAENERRAREDYIGKTTNKPKKKKTKKEKIVYSMEQFYPTINGIAFDDVLTAWWYAQEILDGGKRNDCTIVGLTNKFQSLLNLYNCNHPAYVEQGKKIKYCTLKLNFTLKEEKREE
jgi:hypothetical protein